MPRCTHFMPQKVPIFQVPKQENANRNVLRCHHYSHAWFFALSSDQLCRHCARICRLSRVASLRVCHSRLQLLQSVLEREARAVGRRCGVFGPWRRPHGPRRRTPDIRHRELSLHGGATHTKRDEAK